MSHLHSLFRAVAGSPKPFRLGSLFGRSHTAHSYGPDTSSLLQNLVNQVEEQGSVIDELAGEIGGKKGGSVLQNAVGASGLGGSVLGGLAGAAQGGFSWQSVLKDIFPLGGLFSGIASLFDSTPTPPPLNQYDAPPSLNFNAVLNANGTLSQGSSDQYGYTRGSSPGLDLVDAQGGPYSPYTRASDGSLVAAQGNPMTKYAGTLNLPDLLQPLVQISPAAPPAAPANPQPSFSPAPNLNPQGVNAPTSSTQATPGPEVPSFDQQWFNDHGSLIASAVRTQLLNYHPIVDTINDL